MEWFAVRCVVLHTRPDDPTQTYEERMTLWRARNAEHAIALAEAEVLEYCADNSSDTWTCEYAGLAQSFWLFNNPDHGAEIFSLMRDSDLPPDEYISRFFSDGNEHERTISDDAEPSDPRLA